MVNPYSAYKKQSVTTMTPVEVVIKMYSEIERQLAIAVNAIEANETEKTGVPNAAAFGETAKNIKRASDALIKAQELLGALRGSLDMSVPISNNLEQLYVFFQREAEKANINKNATEIKKIIPMIGDLRDAFTQISQMTKEEIEAQAKANASKK